MAGKIQLFFMDTVFRYLFLCGKIFKPAGLTVFLCCGTAVFISASFFRRPFISNGWYQARSVSAFVFQIVFDFRHSGFQVVIQNFIHHGRCLLVEHLLELIG